MKLLIIESRSGLIELAKNDEKLGAIYGANLLGTIEVAEPKKTEVVVETANLARERTLSPVQVFNVFDEWHFFIPRHAKNVKCTYEIEKSDEPLFFKKGMD